MNSHLTIGQVAKEVGLPSKTIRYYEEVKLIQPTKRMDNKYREYSQENIARLRLIKQARVLGLSLDEVKQLVEECFDGSCEHLRDSFLAKLPKYIESVKVRVNELQELQYRNWIFVGSLLVLTYSLYSVSKKINGYCKRCT